jgi:hypothetical protein
LAKISLTNVCPNSRKGSWTYGQTHEEGGLLLFTREQIIMNVATQTCRRAESFKYGQTHDEGGLLLFAREPINISVATETCQRNVSATYGYRRTPLSASLSHSCSVVMFDSTVGRKITMFVGTPAHRIDREISVMYVCIYVYTYIHTYIYIYIMTTGIEKHSC